MKRLAPVLIAAAIACSTVAGERQPEKLVASLQLGPGATVADLGTGSGFLLPRLAEAVGPEGRVLAQDISASALGKARKRAERRQLANVEFILGTEKDPKLPENGVDLVVTVNAYHHLDYPVEMLAGIRKGLRDGGRLAIVDYYKKGVFFSFHIRLDKDDVIKEVEANGFRLVSVGEHIPDSQYLAIFEKR